MFQGVSQLCSHGQLLLSAGQTNHVATWYANRWFEYIASLFRSCRIGYPRLSCVMSSDEGYIERNAARYRVVRTAQKAFICECFTQQGSWHKTTFAYCKNAVERGAFDPARPDPGARPDLQHAANRPQQQPIQPQETTQGVSVTRIPYEKGRFLW